MNGNSFLRITFIIWYGTQTPGEKMKKKYFTKVPQKFVSVKFRLFTLFKKIEFSEKFSKNIALGSVKFFKRKSKRCVS